jgi:uncharacterized protein
MLDLIEGRRAQLRELCRHYRVRRLDIFGSAARGTFRSVDSDLDFIARFDGTRDPDYAERFCEFAESLEALFGRRVDLLTEPMIRNPYFQEDVEATRLVVIDRDA